MLYNGIKALMLISLLTLSSCALVSKDYTNNPLAINKDQMTGKTWIYSNWSTYNSHKSNGFFNPYIGTHGKTKWLRAQVGTNLSSAIHYRTAILMCQGQEPIEIRQKPFENWSKDFKTSCIGSACSVGETADIGIPDKNVPYVLNCKSELTIRLVGDAHYAQFTYSSQKNSKYFLGLNDLMNYWNHFK